MQSTDEQRLTASEITPTSDPCSELGGRELPDDPDAQAYELFRLRGNAQQQMLTALTSKNDSDRRRAEARYDCLQRRIRKIKRELDRTHAA